MRIRAAVLRESGLPPPYAESQPVLVDEVELEPPGPDEVLVRNLAAGICHSDLSVVDGSRPRPLPMVLGHEAVGVVEDSGPTGDLESGQHVVYSFVPACGACLPCRSGRAARCEPGGRANLAGTLLTSEGRLLKHGRRIHHHLGVSAFAERSVVARASLVEIPAHVPTDVAALFGCALTTGVGAVVNTAGVRPGQSVAVFGLGGVGLSAVMGAVLAGAHPIVAVDPVASKRQLAERIGATHTLHAGSPTEEAVRDLTGGGVEVAIEAVGSAAVLESAYAAVRRGGMAVSVGLAHPEQVVRIQAVSLVAEEKRLLGSYMGSAVPHRDIPMLIGLYEAGRLPVELLATHTLGLDLLNEGFDRMRDGTQVRQIVRLEPREVSHAAVEL